MIIHDNADETNYKLLQRPIIPNSSTKGQAVDITGSVRG